MKNVGMSRRPGARFNRGRIATAAGGAAVSYPLTTGLLANISTFYGDDTTHLTTGGTSKVQQYVNQVSSVAWAQGTAADQASWEADSLSSSMNGLPSAHPDGSDYYFNTEAAILNIVANNTPFVLFVVANANVAAAAQYIFGWGNSAAAIGYRGVGFDATGVFLSNGNDGAGKSVLGTTVLANKQPYVFALKSNGTQSAAWINAVVEWALTAQSLAALTINRASLGSRPRSTNDIKHVGQIGEFLLYGAAHTLTDADIVAQSAWLVERWKLLYRMVIPFGDSLSRGFGSVSAELLSDRLPLASNSGKWIRYNGATNGYTTTDLLSVFAARITARRRWAAAKDVVLLWIGTNDVTDTADSAAVIYGRITTIIDQAQALGCEVVACTLINRADAVLSGDGITPANTVIASINALIITNTAGAEAIVDLNTLINVTNGAEANTAPNAWYSDDTHGTDLLYDTCAVAQGAAVDSV